MPMEWYGVVMRKSFVCGGARTLAAAALSGLFVVVCERNALALSWH
jgi:hypothetical protein